VSTPSGFSFGFAITPQRKDSLINGLDEIGFTLKHADGIRTFEAASRITQPWLWRAAGVQSGA
jgi:3-isopropylmalate/(R)-2-methylmalate dehydratase small subunit